MSILQTIDLKKYYGTEPNITRALDGVNFSVEDGEFWNALTLLFSPYPDFSYSFQTVCFGRGAARGIGHGQGVGFPRRPADRSSLVSPGFWFAPAVTTMIAASMISS